MNIKEKIIEVLSKHTEGLTFTQIARELGMHRHTITKYIYELKGEGIISIRDLKTLKLCYLKEHFAEEIREKQTWKNIKTRLEK